VRVLDEDGDVAEVVDIRRPLRIEMEYDVRESGHILLPHLYVHNDEGVCAFGAQDLDPGWRGQKRPAGRYVSTAWIPGNLLSEGMLFVDANMIALDPFIFQYRSQSAVAFMVADSLEGDSARSDWSGHMPGVVRPMFKWTTQYSPAAAETAVGSGSRS
jgi:lipopolysaccharide transport system ATP-binding protein